MTAPRACGVCGAPARPPFQAPPPELAPDLDLRPGEPTRSTLPRWVATCRRCTAAAPDLTALPATLRATIDSPAFQALQGSALPFLRWAMLAEAAGDRQEAAEALLQAAWTLDDAGEDAAPLRHRAAGLWDGERTVEDGLRLVDVLRRAGAMEEAAARAAALLAGPPLEETDRTLLCYQQRLIAAGDADRHLLSSALRPPARTPHAAHGRPVPRGFWQRLVGR